MARRKRASLKDKGPEALGLTQKRRKGIDVLFGGPPGDKASSASDTPDTKVETGTTETGQLDPDDTMIVSSEAGSEPGETNEVSELETGVDEMVVNSNDIKTGSVADDTITPPPVPSTIPGETVDEFGLPVAMEGPPDDLELASPPLATTVEPTETDAFDPSLSPFAVPTTPAVPPLDDDLSALAEEDEIPGLTPEPEIPTPPPVEAAPVGGTGDELAGLGPDEPLPDVATAPAAEPPLTTPPPTPDPFAAPPPVYAPPSVEVSPPVTVPAAPPPTPATTVAAPRPIVESLGGIITERIVTADEDILPPDLSLRPDASNVLALQARAQVERDEAIAEKVMRYIGQERRENLDKEIERLYDQVATELSVNKTDAEFALKALSEAQDIVFEDARQYDEALYRVAVVKTMLARKQNLKRWSYTWGLGVFFYAVVWLAAFIAGFILNDFLSGLFGDKSTGLATVLGAWFSALAGGVGGIIGIFYSLYWHVAMKQDFDRQYVMYYLVQPIMGFILGAVVYFIVIAGFLVFNVSNQSAEAATAIAVVFGFVAGFRQRVVFEMIDRIVKKLLPRGQDEPDQNPVSLIPAEHRENIPPTS